MENQTTEQETPVFELETLKAESLPQLQGWREKQEALVAATPFISCKNHKSYTQAKKNRTALVSARTSIEGQEKLIASQLKKFRNRVGEASKELIAITKPHEDKQQAEVSRYEEAKKSEREEKERQEEERKKAIKDRINNFYVSWKEAIENLKFNRIEVCKQDIVDSLEMQEDFDFAEFQDQYNEKVVLLRELFKDRVKYLNEQEELRKEKKKLDEEIAKEEAERKKHQAKEKALRDAEAEKLRKEREELEAERKLLADEKALREAVAEKERKDEEEKKRLTEEKKRLKALKPDKEKAEAVIKSLTIDYHPEITIKDREIDNLLAEYVGQSDLLMKSFLDKLSKIN